MLLFRSEEHVDRWCMKWGQQKGAVFTLEQIWGLAKGWYSDDRRAPDWRRKTKEEAQQLLDSLGLSGPFWEL